LRQLLFYFTAVKSKSYEKLINARFFEIKNLIYRIKTAVAADRNIWDDIALITVLEGLSKKYDAKKKGFLNQKAVIIKDAQQILTFEEIRISTDR